MRNNIQKSAQHNTIYGMGFIGALVYFISTATSLWTGVVGVVKSIFWPAFLIYEVLSHLGM
ncbi:MAG: hypothetical protein R3275_04250 [Saprospiraceae bacterium]|nr:hypothetical protein [Saprospiraceae bacterium]